MKKGCFVKLTEAVNEEVLVRIGIKKDIAEQMLENLKEKTFEVIEPTGYGAIIKVNNTEVQMLKKYIQKA